MEHKMPDEGSVHQMLSMLLGDGLSVSAAAENGQSYVAIYVNADDETKAAAVCDTAFAAYSGAALTMLPPGGAQDAAASNDLSETMLNNLYEVMNICTRLLIGDATPHLRLTKVCPVDETEALTVLAESAQGHFQVDIPRYGCGGLSFLVS